MTHTTRREFLSALALASIPSILPASTKSTSSANSSAARFDKRDFGPVRDRILKEIAAGSATGVAVAVVHKGQIIWEEGLRMGKSRGGCKGDLPYAIQPGIPHETLRHYDAHDSDCRGQALFGRSRK